MLRDQGALKQSEAQSLASRPKSTEPALARSAWAYNRNLVERLWARLKAWRAVATRYVKTAASFTAVLGLAASTDWLKREQALEGGAHREPSFASANAPNSSL